MSDLYNLAVDLQGRGAQTGVDGIEFSSDPADETVLAWIDDVFGGCWSSEAYAGSTIVARRAGHPVGFAAFDPQGLTFRWLRGQAQVPGTGLFGPFGVDPSLRSRGIGRALLDRAMDALRARGYTRALVAAAGEGPARYYEAAIGARIAERFDRNDLLAPAPSTVVLASGDGSNLQSVLDAAREGTLPLDVVSVIANRAHAFAIERARNAGVPAHLVAWDRQTETRQRYDERLHAAVAAFRPDLVLLLGWMHLLDRAFVSAFPHLLNLHPAFLPLDPQRDDVGLPDGTRIPAFRGAHAVTDAIAHGSEWIGATVHAVTPSTDRGPVYARRPLRREPGQSESALFARLHALERTVVASAIKRYLYERP